MNLPIKNYNAIAFDFDGTLANTYATHSKARLEAFAVHGYDHITPQQHELGHTYGTQPQTIIAGVLKEAGELALDADPHTHPTVSSLVQQKTVIYHELVSQGLDAQPGALEFIRRVAGRFSGRMAIVSTASIKEIEPFLKRHELEHIFRPSLIISEETTKEYNLASKPAPDSYNLAIERLKLADNPSAVLTVEDSTFGVQAARAANSTVLAVGYTHGQEAFAELPPDYYAASFADIQLV